MDQRLIVQPVVALFLLTALVWLYMYVWRLSYMWAHQISPQSAATPEAMNALLPASVNNPSNNLKNLFELPVVFYALCAMLWATQHADPTYLNLAWAYVGLRAVHSAIHCTANIVAARFTAYFLSALVLWFMVGRFAMTVF